MSRKLIIAEKPSVAVTIAKTLGCKPSTGYWENDYYIVTWCLGHLLELKNCDDYLPGFKWSLDKFPFIPSKFEYKVRTDPKTKNVDNGAEQQLKIIKNLADRSDVDQIINSLDNDREGTLIFLTVANYLGFKKPIYRLKLNEWTPAEIKSALGKVTPNANEKTREDAAECRQHADNMLGINFTSVATLKYTKGRGKYALSIGRVILPTLNLLYTRYMEIKNFVPKEYYELKATFDTNKGKYDGLLLNPQNESRFERLEDILQIQKEIAQKTAFVKEKKVTRSKQNAPSLFNLNDLEGYITSKYSGWTSDKVDKIAQVLYEGKGNGGFISYPRTKSRHLESTNEFINKAKNVLETLKKGLPFESEINFHANKTVFNSAMVDGHGAIIPTYIIPTGLTKDEQLVYDAVKNRFIAQFMPPAEYENTEILTQILGTVGKDILFITKGKILVTEGWQKVYGKESQDEVLPPLEKGDKAAIQKLEPLTKQTQPPNHYTEKTLFKAMETCGKKVKDSDSDEVDEAILSAILSGYQIGTPATRSETVKKMRTVGYVELKGKSLVITELGINLIKVFPVHELKDLDFTGKLEKTLSDIEKGKRTKGEFMSVIKNMTIAGVEKIKQSNGLVADYTTGENAEKEGLFSCPECGKPVIEGIKGYSCSGWREGCKFVIWKNNAFLSKFNINGVDKKTAKALVEKPEGVELRANSTIILAKLVKSEDKYNLEFEVKEGEKYSLGKCPECGSNVVINSKAYTCENSSCCFVIFKDDKFLAQYKKKPSEAMIKSLLKNGMVKVSNMTSPSGKGKFDCILKLKKKNEKYWGFEMEFDKADSNEGSASGDIVGKCLDCGSDVIETGSLYKCSNTSCSFVLYKDDKFLSKFNKKLTKTLVKQFLKEKKAYVKDLFSQKKNKYFDATVLLFKNGQYWNFKFDI